MPTRYLKEIVQTTSDIWWVPPQEEYMEMCKGKPVKKLRDKLFRDIEMLSNYNLTVTALCNGEPSKDAKLKIKTTNIPASYRNLRESCK